MKFPNFGPLREWLWRYQLWKRKSWTCTLCTNWSRKLVSVYSLAVLLGLRNNHSYDGSKIEILPGGFGKVCLHSKWSEIAAQMNYSRGRSYARLLKPIYERLLYPYELAQQVKRLLSSYWLILFLEHWSIPTPSLCTNSCNILLEYWFSFVIC